MRRRIARWVFDWHNGATLLATVLVALFVVVILHGAIAQRQANETANRALDTADNANRAAQDEVQRSIDARQAATRRIDSLQQTIGAMYVQVQEVNRLAAESVAREEALSNQVKRLGAVPVVSVVPLPPVTTMLPATPTTTTTTTQKPSTTTTTRVMTPTTKAGTTTTVRTVTTLRTTTTTRRK